VYTECLIGYCGAVADADIHGDKSHVQQASVASADLQLPSGT